MHPYGSPIPLSLYTSPSATLPGGRDGTQTLRLLWRPVRATSANSASDLLPVTRLPARPQTPVAARKTPHRSRLPGQSARSTTRVAGTQSRLLAAVSARSFGLCGQPAGPTTRTTDSRFSMPRKDGCVHRTVWRVSNHADVPARWHFDGLVAGRDHTRVSDMSAQDGRVQREDLIDIEKSGIYRCTTRSLEPFAA